MYLNGLHQFTIGTRSTSIFQFVPLPEKLFCRGILCITFLLICDRLLSLLVFLDLTGFPWSVSSCFSKERPPVRSCFNFFQGKYFRSAAWKGCSTGTHPLPWGGSQGPSEQKLWGKFTCEASLGVCVHGHVGSSSTGNKLIKLIY